MAEAVFQVLIEKVSSLIQKEIGLIMGVDKEMKKLQSTLSTIQLVLEDAESKQLKNKPLQNWLSKLNEAAYDIEDILDECITELSKLERKAGKFKYLKKILFSRKIGRRMKEMTETLVGLAAERQNFHLREIVVPHSSKHDCRRETGFILNEPNHVYGRDEDREKIVGMLVNDQIGECDDEHLFVLPILGVGGLGKTTLAQLVYHDEKVSQHFDTKLWVCVSDHFDLKILLESIIVSATGSASNLVQLDALQRRVWEVLSHKKCLLVLDDVWNDNQEDWVKLKSILLYASKGLSIVVTTRLRKVANIMGTTSTHSLEGLSEEYLWLLFKLRAFGHEGEEHPNLEAIGQQILKKCAGVPLAAKALGGLLRFKREEKDWIHVRESEIWDLPEEETQILPALRLSYHHLPLKLRQCFAYCAVFPKDYKMVKQDLIFRWMAHGFISSSGVQEVEDVGDQVWNEFVLRSIFQEVSTFEWRTTCKMHDLVHDLARSIVRSKDYGLQMESNILNGSCRKVRGMFYFRNSFSSTTMLTSIMDYTRLRTLKIQDEKTEELPSAINKLKHLRYLELACPQIRSLPLTFCSLWNLQILNLNCCFELWSLPKNIRYMTNLRHIFLQKCFKLSDMPCGIGEMTFLKTLSVFIVGQRAGNQLDQLQHLNLGGRLEILHLERTKNPRNARKANLVEKPNLQGLVLSWDYGWEELASMMDEEMVVEALEPHPNLKTLSIIGFNGSHFPIWMTKMNNVTEIRIQSCRNSSHISPIAHLPHLKKLFLWDLWGLEYIVDQNEIQGQSSAGAKLFPSLEELSLKTLPNLKRLIKEGEMMLPNLRQLDVSICEQLSLHPFEVSNLKRLILWISRPSVVVSSFSKANLENVTYLELDFKLSRATYTLGDAWDGLCNLIKMQVRGAGEQHLSEKWFQGVKSLKSLEVTNCEIETNIIGGWLRHLTALEMLAIDVSLKLEELPEEIEHLRLLKCLRLDSLYNLASLPQALQHLPSLKSIQLSHLPQLTSLPECLHYLTSLDIYDCPMLISLPSAMPNLTSLVIHKCPQLERRCKQEDWHKISHIPYLRIGACSNKLQSMHEFVLCESKG